MRIDSGFVEPFDFAVLSDAVGKELLLEIAAEVGEWHDRDRAAVVEGGGAHRQVGLGGAEVRGHGFPIAAHTVDADRSADVLTAAARGPRIRDPSYRRRDSGPFRRPKSRPVVRAPPGAPQTTPADLAAAETTRSILLT
jgi:hypothetical protein